MRLQRTKNTVNQFLFGTINRFVGIFVPFFLRTAVIHYLGEEYLGVNSLFTSILSVLNMAELGFSVAVGNSLYRPIAEENVETVCALMALYRKVYRIIGTAVFSVGILIIPFLDQLINGECPSDLNMYLLYMIYLLSSTSGYFMFAYKQAILSAYQRGDIVDNISTVVKLITSFMQFVAIIVYRNIYVYVILNAVHNIICNLCCARIATRKYPQYVCKGKVSSDLKREIYKKVGGLFVQKLGQALSTQLDTVVISSCIGLIAVARYSNYLYISNSVGSFIQLFFGAMTAGIGNAMVLNTVEWNYKTFQKIQFISMLIVSWCSICLLCLYQPFVSVWTGADTVLSFPIVVLMVIYFYIQYNKRVVTTYKDAAGMWWEDKFKPLVSGVFNLSINLILVRYIGISGVVISTILSFLLIEMPWETHVLFKGYFKRKEWSYYFTSIKYALITSIIAVITLVLTSLIPLNGISRLLCVGLVCCIIPVVLLILVYFRNPMFGEVGNMLKGIISRKQK